MIDCEAEYERETGKEASIKTPDSMNAGKFFFEVADDYVTWLEEKLEASAASFDEWFGTLNYQVPKGGYIYGMMKDAWDAAVKHTQTEGKK